MLQELFSTEERIRILEVILYEKGVTNSYVTQRSKVNKGLVSIFLRSLMNKNIIEKDGRTYHFRSTPLVRQLKILMNLTKIVDLKEHLPSSVLGLGVFGSWSEGKNDIESDIDIWIMMKDLENQVVGKLIELISERTDSEPNILTLTPSKWERMKKDDGIFASSISRTSITLVGIGIEQV